MGSLGFVTTRPPAGQARTASRAHSGLRPTEISQYGRQLWNNCYRIAHKGQAMCRNC